MLLAGSEHGLYRITGLDRSADWTAEPALDCGAVMRIRRFERGDGPVGVLAATETGLYQSPDGETWTDLGVPREQVYAVGGDGEGTIYAGTRPAHLYAADANEGDAVEGLDWRALEGFQELPSRDEWRLPRHEDLAQVRDVHVDPAGSDRIVAGVEVGGVHVSDDAGQQWTERRDGVADDVHELVVVGPGEYVAATGFGLFRTTDAGRSWTRLDGGYEQRYFRSAAVVDGTVYAGAALAHTATWSDADADPQLFVARDGATVEPVGHPRPDETVTGMTDVDGALVATTHRGTVLVDRGSWSVLGSLPAPDGFAGSYTPLAFVS